MNKQGKNDSETHRSGSEPQLEVEFGSYFDKDQPSWLPGSDRHRVDGRGYGLRRKPRVNSVDLRSAGPDVEARSEEGRDGPEVAMPPRASNRERDKV
jgi:hypothetical protein